VAGSPLVVRPRQVARRRGAASALLLALWLGSTAA
jgi:hypothetical protein